tara:strand:+ start:673 stop:819 length:147 start_codon:yes stop_codon:yes gene_type:complete
MQDQNKEPKSVLDEVGRIEKKDKKKTWKKPTLEDVSGKVMAQPYIRFT